ncbi:hypothetical protein FRB96_002817 [Tulasnella sp. 330]|nr:hypothetical protein FRB96_002817 [Tulasnella sp. 330]
MDIGKEIINLALLTAQSVHPAAALLNVIWQEFQTVQNNRGKIKFLLERCKRVIGAIDQELDRKPALDVERSIKQLMRHLRFIEQMMRNLKNLGFMKSLLRKDEIASQIEESHVRLTDCLAIFQVTAAVDLREYHEDQERARVADQEELSNQLATLERNDMEVMRRFDVLNNQVEAMMAIQNTLIKKVDNSPEHRILQVALSSLQMNSGKKIPKKLPEWTITAFDVEIETEAQIGHGGFSTVKRGKWGRLTVAVKEIAQTTDPKVLLKEIEAWSRLRHDHVLPFYGASVVASPPFIVSRYMANGNVLSYLSLNPNANRVKLIHEIALGMLYIHNKGVIHGDLKGLNILIDDSTKACIADFGLSKIKQNSSQWTVAQVTQSGSAVSTANGTLRFMSPEALRGVMNKATDVYAYAMTLYEIFTGTTPFLLVPDAAMYTHISEKHTRLTRPTEPVIINRGLTTRVWILIWNTSNPLAHDRPDFDSVCETTERLVEERQENIDAGCVELEGKDHGSEDLLDLLGEMAESATTVVANSDDDEWKQKGKALTNGRKLSDPSSSGTLNSGVEHQPGPAEDFEAQLKIPVPSTVSVSDPVRVVGPVDTGHDMPSNIGAAASHLTAIPSPPPRSAAPSPALDSMINLMVQSKLPASSIVRGSTKFPKVDDSIHTTELESQVPKEATSVERRFEARSLTGSSREVLVPPGHDDGTIHGRARAGTDLQRSTRVHDRRASGLPNQRHASQNDQRPRLRTPRRSADELRLSPGQVPDVASSNPIVHHPSPKEVARQLGTQTTTSVPSSSRKLNSLDAMLEQTHSNEEPVLFPEVRRLSLLPSTGRNVLLLYHDAELATKERVQEPTAFPRDPSDQ